MSNSNRLVKATNISMIKCVKITMSDNTEYTVKVDDLVGIQFVKDNDIVVRRGRISDLVVINYRELSKTTDNVSHIVLDCSEQFTVKVVDIKFSDIIKIGSIDDEFNDYDNRITELGRSDISETEECVTMPVRENTSTPRAAVTARGFALTR